MDPTLARIVRNSASLRTAILRATCHFVSCSIILTLNLGLTAAARSIDDTDSTSTKPSELLIADWVARGEHRDLPWQLAVSQPVLRYDQTSYVMVRAKMSGADLRKKGLHHDLHFMVIVADEAGKWLDGSGYSHQLIGSDVSGEFELEFQMPIIFGPGKFRIAAIIYDAALDRRNVTFRRVAVHPPGREPFPELFSRLPRVSFEWGRVSSFPVRTQRPVQMDLVIEFSSHYVYKGRLSRLIHVPRIFGPAEALTRLNLENGCVRVTGLDSLNLQTVIPSQPASAVDWQIAEQNIAAEDSQSRLKVSAAALATQPSLEAANYFLAELQKLLAMEQPACPATSAKPLHVVVILTGGVDFVRGTAHREIESRCDCIIFYLHSRPPFESVFNGDVMDFMRVDRPSNDRLGGMADASRLPQGSPSGDGSDHGVLRPGNENAVHDHLKGMVKPLSPRVFEFSSPLQFRTKFFDFLTALKNLSGTSNSGSTQDN